MGWTIWDKLPLASCIIISLISLLKLLQPHIIPSEKQIDKLDEVADFYFEYYNKLEQLWMSYYYSKIDDAEVQSSFYEIKKTEAEINKTVYEIVKRTNKKIYKRTDLEARAYFKNTFNTQ